MKPDNSGIVIGSLVGIAVLCGLAGAAVGYRLGRQEVLQRADPETWHERASRKFHEVVRPTPQQEERVGVHLDAALAELRQVREEAIRRSGEVIDRLVTAVERELTPEQKAAFETMKRDREAVSKEALRIKEANPP